MNLTKDEKQNLMEKIREKVLDEIVARAVNKTLEMHKDRIEKHCSEVAHQLAGEIGAKYPL